MHDSLATWRQAMLDLEAAQRQNAPPHLLANAIQRAGETHEAVLRAVIFEVGELKRALRGAADRTQATISSGELDLHSRIDLFAARLSVLELAVAALQAASARLLLPQEP